MNPAMSISDQLASERMRVDFDSYDISVQQLLLMVEQYQIDVAPTYQRRFRWDVERQSVLIESVFLGIPIPNLFMATNADGTWEAVDGVQRLSTIVHFAGGDNCRRALSITDQLELKSLEKLSAMNGHTFAALPPSARTQFLLRPLKITTLTDKSDLKIRFDLFERLNTGGVKLTAQEIRGCIYRGAFNDFLEKLALNDDFRKVVILRATMEHDGTREEYILRFFAFLNSYETFDHSVVGFLNEYMASATRTFNYAAGEKLFNHTFAELARIFPDGISRRTRLTPVNLFEAIAVGAAIALKKKVSLPNRPTTWADSKELKSLTSGATNSQRMVAGRIEFVAKKLGG